MGERISPQLTRLLNERKLLKFRGDRKLILKEIEGATYDLEKAKRSLSEGDAKWAIVQ